MADQVLPQFENEAEEARWWFEHREEIGKEIVAASRQGRLGEGSVARRERKLRELGSRESAEVKLHSSR